jgi:hypothetical protein
VLTVAGYRHRTGQETTQLAVGSAVSLAAVDAVYVSKGRISPVHLLAALAGRALVAAWAIVPDARPSAGPGRPRTDPRKTGQPARWAGTLLALRPAVTNKTSVKD